MRFSPVTLSLMFGLLTVHSWPGLMVIWNLCQRRKFIKYSLIKHELLDLGIYFLES